MDLFTLIKANIRRKKGTFISILILMLISSMSLTLILSVRKSCDESLEDIYSYSDSATVLSYIRDSRFTAEMEQKLRDHPLIDHINVIQSVGTDQAVVSNHVNNNTWYLTPLVKDLKLVNSSCTGYEKDLPKLQKGEIYLSYGSKAKLKCNLGEKITIYACHTQYEFTIKGFVAEPMLGSMNMGWKWQFVSDEDFAKILADAKKEDGREDHYWACKLVEVYRAKDCSLSDLKFKRQINLDTGLVSSSWGSQAKETSAHYTNIYAELILGIMFAFIIILVIVVLIVMGHSISTGIEMDYTNLGILKAQGFSSLRIKSMFLIQYLFAEVIGTVFGIAAAIPLIGVLTSVFDNMSGFIADTKIAVGKTLIVLALIFAVSTLFILFSARKVSKITPIRAISGGKSEIYFDSRLKAPIGQKGLSALLALRQFTSSKRRYIASVVIASLLIFFMLMINGIGDTLNSKKAVEMMGGYYYDVEIYLNERINKDVCDKIVKAAEEVTEVHARYFNRQQYFSINGEEISCSIRAYPEDTYVSKGRACIYDNEIAVTELVADELGIKIGDKVTVTKNEYSGEYIVSGYFPCMNDTGKAFMMSLDGACKLGLDNSIGFGGLNLSDSSKAAEVVNAINAKFGNDLFTAKDVSDGEEDDEEFEMYNTAVFAMKTVIYSFSIIFALIVISMVCSKAFTQEKTDIGIYKSQGFTSRNLRMQFAVRFLIVAVIGSVIGTVFGLMFIEKILTMLLKSLGIASFYCDFTVLSVSIPIAVICLCFFVFAYFVSRKIKKVGIRQLVTE